MKNDRRLDLLRDVLDHEIVDVDQESCGMVDDIEFTSTTKGPAVAALVVGPGASIPRLPALFAVIGAWFFGTAKVRVPWKHVVEISEVIRLDVKASEVRLGKKDRRVQQWLARLPKS